MSTKVFCHEHEADHPGGVDPDHSRPAVFRSILRLGLLGFLLVGVCFGIGCLALLM